MTPRLGVSISKSKSPVNLKCSVQEELVFSCVAHLEYNCQETTMPMNCNEIVILFDFAAALLNQSICYPSKDASRRALSFLSAVSIYPATSLYSGFAENLMKHIFRSLCVKFHQ